MNTLIIFIKAPVPGKVKTRLVPPLTPQGAAALYRAFARDTLALARRVSGIRIEVAYDALGGPSRPEWLGDTPFFPQEGQDLGERLKRAFSRAFSAGASRVAVIGSDIPHLDPGLIERAFSRLERSDVVIGPCPDGGYYLIGLNHPCPELFDGISWSTSEVLTETVAALSQKGLSFGLLAEQSDIDTARDLELIAERPEPDDPSVLENTRRVLAGTALR